jgi:3-isopropylmalate/(R)-2-methylmalate dehydratase large subunit
LRLNLIQKILQRKKVASLSPGSYITVSVDGLMASDTTAPEMIRSFYAMAGGEGKKIRFPERLSLVLDHASPAPTEAIARLHQMIRAFAKDQGCHLYDAGDGICHHLMLDHGHVRPGDIFMGADSHTCTYGAIGAFACGVGSTDLAAALYTGFIWLRVPQTIRVNLWGKPPFGVYAKDVMLFLMKLLGPDGCHYKAIEFGGDYLKKAALAARIPFANMTAELGAKTGIVEHPDHEYLWADRGASYAATFDVDLEHLSPQIALPHAPTQTCAISEVSGRKIHTAFLGSCTNTRIEDLREAAAVVRGKKIAPFVRFFIVPATRQVMLEATRDGTLATLLEAGATILPSGCGPCVGTHMGVPGDGETVISAANRNFKGRMGNPKAEVYLASPAAVAASAVCGVLSNPQEFLREE